MVLGPEALDIEYLDPRGRSTRACLAKCAVERSHLKTRCGLDLTTKNRQTTAKSEACQTDLPKGSKCPNMIVQSPKFIIEVVLTYLIPRFVGSWTLCIRPSEELFGGSVASPLVRNNAGRGLLLMT